MMPTTQTQTRVKEARYARASQGTWSRRRSGTISASVSVNVSNLEDLHTQVRCEPERGTRTLHAPRPKSRSTRGCSERTWVAAVSAVEHRGLWCGRGKGEGSGACEEESGESETHRGLGLVGVA